MKDHKAEAQMLAHALTSGECIARGYMPQIDESDLPALLAFLGDRGVRHRRENVDPTHLTMHQRIVPSKVRGIARRTEVLDKPCLIASDYTVLDGNHRAAAARVMRRALPVIIFDEKFAEMLVHLFAFPATYAYGDGSAHPVRN